MSVTLLVWLNIIQVVGIVILVLDNFLNRRAAFKTLARVAALVEAMVNANKPNGTAVPVTKPTDDGWRGPG